MRVLGYDLGKAATGWAVYDSATHEVVEHGTVRALARDTPGEVFARFAAEVHERLESNLVEAVAYEEVRHMRGQGARWILGLEAIVLLWCQWQGGVLCQGVNVATLKAYSRGTNEGLWRRTWEARRGILPRGQQVPFTASDMRDFWPELPAGMSDDAVVAAWAARWLADKLREGGCDA